MIKLFLYGFIQVLFVAINTIMLANKNFAGTFIIAFGIGLIWSSNVKRMSISSTKERIIYSFGSALGSITALIIT